MKTNNLTKEKITSFLFSNLTNSKQTTLNINLPSIPLKNYTFLENNLILQNQTNLLLKLKNVQNLHKNFDNFEQILILKLEELLVKIRKPKNLNEVINYFYEKIDQMSGKIGVYKVYSGSVGCFGELQCGYDDFYEESEMIFLNEKVSCLKIKENENEEIKLEEKINKKEKEIINQPIKNEPIKKEIENQPINEKINTADFTQNEPKNYPKEPHNPFSFNQPSSFLTNLQSPQTNFFTNSTQTSSIFNNVLNQNQSQEQPKENVQEFTSQGSALSKLTSKFNTKFKK
ncbi:hypothetical protein TUBRATIS_18330 [Tubulinosema ratisbonensis]|uniref:Uncharacterized protein n=1 Tax=Tubulinosema ratisbonensis TaxID=291195 RepID=A0A437AKU1_9MICR|nr:hypothetical protein TUBRATIS_18330 [Tubulinosema ratisbonensis]